MIHYKNLTLIGTSHIAKQSVKEVEGAIKEIKPRFVCLELDKQRFITLSEGKHTKVGLASIKQIGIKGFLFVVLGQFIQKKLGKIVGMVPGSEMMHAANVARSLNIKIALIDQDITITLRKFSENLTWKEKWQFVKDIFRGLFFRKKVIKEMGLENFDLSKVPDKETIRKLIRQVKKNYPNIYRVLIEERNIIMANNLFGLMNHLPEERLVAVVGAGHEDDIYKIIQHNFINLKQIEKEQEKTQKKQDDNGVTSTHH